MTSRQNRNRAEGSRKAGSPQTTGVGVNRAGNTTGHSEEWPVGSGASRAPYLPGKHLQPNGAAPGGKGNLRIGGVSDGIRTRVFCLPGRYPGPLDDAHHRGRRYGIGLASAPCPPSRSGAQSVGAGLGTLYRTTAHAGCTNADRIIWIAGVPWGWTTARFRRRLTLRRDGTVCPVCSSPKDGCASDDLRR